jgi:sulfatase maturation enzyme AslB (radical SAM superfamily)
MHCPRLDHFVRLNPNGTVGRCGHMTRQPQFPTLESMDTSEWLGSIKESMTRGIWPIECERCMETEQLNGTSIRLNAIKFDQLQKQSDYLIVGGVLDNICNSACLTCDEQHSTLIGGLKSKVYTIVDNSDKFWQLPLDRVVHLDISGGEPSHSKNYKHILAHLPGSIRSIRLNTNCSSVLEELWELCSRGIHVTVTVSLDGIGPVHDLVRWPVKWDKFYGNLQRYMEMPITLNTWTTVSALNVDDLPNILEFVKQHKLDHSYAFLKDPVELTVENKDTVESKDYIQRLKQDRGIN